MSEEQVAIPWPRVCAVATGYACESGEIALVETLMAACPVIAREVYSGLIEQFPNACSRRGMVRSDDVQRSTLRDLVMLQAYLWLALLEKNTEVLEKELLPLCLMIFPSVNVPVAVIQRGIKLLVAQVEWYTPASQLFLIRPYTQQLVTCFQDWGSPGKSDPTYAHHEPLNQNALALPGHQDGGVI